MIERLLAGDAALDRDDLEVADRLFSQVADADPRNAIAVVGLARVAARRLAPDEASALARRALDIDPDEAAAKRLLDELEAPAKTPRPLPIAQPAITATTGAARPPRPRWRRWIDRLLRRG